MRPLEGLRVIELGHAIAGPICAYQLARLGADVIKIERPDVGDDFRHYYEHGKGENTSIPFAVYNAGKRSIELDLRTDEGIEIARELIDGADAFVSNLRPGTCEKLGLGWSHFEQSNPGLVHCEISGYGSGGPLRDWPAYDHIAQAVSGLMSINGEEGQPSRIAVALVDIFTGELAASGIMAAIIERGRTGKGQHLDVAMLDAAMLFLANPIASFTFSGVEPVRVGNTGFRPSATSDVYECADGHVTIGCNLQEQFERLCEILGAPELVEDPRFATSAPRIANRLELRAELERLFKARSAFDLEEKLTAANVPAARNRRISELCAEPHVRERGMVEATAATGLDGEVMVVGPGFRSSTGVPGPAGPVPGLGEHTAEILAELGRSSD